MRGSWQRQTALTNNIANADTPGYKPQEVNFESDAAERDERRRIARARCSSRPKPSRRKRAPTARGVSVDQESAKLAENGLDYQALTQVVGARNSIMRAAMGVCPDGALRRDRHRRQRPHAPSASAWTSPPRTSPTPTPPRPPTASPTSARRSSSAAGRPGRLRRRALERDAAERSRARPPAASQVTGIVSDSTPDQQVYDPGNPEADAKGYVKMPNISTVTEMTDLISERSPTSRT